MPVAAFAPNRLHTDYAEWTAPGIAHNGKVWAWNNTSGKYEPTALAFDPAGTAAAAVAAHVAASDPHSQYLLASGVSAFGASLIDDGDAAAGRATLGLGALATASVPGSTTQVIYNSAGALTGDAGMTYDAANGRLTVAGGLIAPSWRPASDSTTALQLQNAAGTAVMTVDTTNSRLKISPGGTGARTALEINPDLLLVQGNIVKINGYQESAFLLAQSHNPSLNSGLDSPALLFMGRWNSASTIYDIYQSIALTPTSATGYRFGIGSYGNDYAINIVRTENRVPPVGINTIAPSGQLSIVPNYDSRIALLITGVAAQSANLQEWRNSNSTILASVGATGVITIQPLSAATNTIQNNLIVAHNTSGTPAAGFGLGIAARLESSTTEDQDAGRLTWEWVTATHASRASRGKLSAYYTSTEQTAMTWDGDTGGVKLGFYGVTAVARQLLATGAGATVDDVITALQALGLVRQS